VTRFGRQWVTVTVVFSEAPAPGMTPTVVVMTGGPPPSSNSARETLVRWVDNMSLGGNGG
jgi:hypothetical protein